MNGQYQTLCIGKLVRIDRLLNGFHVREDRSGRETAQRLVRRASSQSERFCTALPQQVSESVGATRRELFHLPELSRRSYRAHLEKEMPCLSDFTRSGSLS